MGALARLLAAFAFAVLLIAPVSDTAVAQEPAAAAEVPPKVKELIEILKDPAVADWLSKQAAQKPPAGDAMPGLPGIHQAVDGWMTSTRAKLVGVKQALTQLLPVESRNAATALKQELQAYGLTRAWPLAAGFLLVGLGSLLAAVWATRTSWARFTTQPIVSQAARFAAVRGRAGVALIRLAAFFAGSMGVFLLFEWPPLVRSTVAAALIAAQGVALAVAAAAVLLSPPTSRFPDAAAVRVLPLDDGAARFWFGKVVAVAAIVCLGAMTAGAMRPLGFSEDSRLAVSYVFALALAAVFLFAVWRASAAGFPGPQRWLATLYALVLMVLWGIDAQFVFWLMLLTGLVPLVIWLAEEAVRHLVRPVGETDEPVSMERGLMTAAVQRGIRSLILLAGLFLLDRELPDAFSMQADLRRIVTGIVHAAMILVVFDFAWHLTNTFLTRQISRLKVADGDEGAAAVRRQRLGTLLPILRNVLLVTFGAIGVLMALSAMGVPIGPLLAGASVFGVAVGFGSQTLVKDVLSGVFYLLDDAFRVGEYIQSGNYRGTVEGFTLRSVRLRHQRGPVYTVPFGTLGAIQNLSRDWVIEKMLITVPFDTNIMKAKKLIKQVGQELLQDPELKPSILETLKMQGVEEFGDYGIKLRLKLMTKPGEQFMARRRAFARIKELFDENGISLATPTVNVGEGGTGAAAHLVQHEAAKAAASGG
jgi:small-conductance mechanosensitive channel